VVGTDELLVLWLETGDRVASTFPVGWADRARAALARYDELAARHPYSGKHRHPKSNLGILLACLREQLDDGGLTPRPSRRPSSPSCATPSRPCPRVSAWRPRSPGWPTSWTADRSMWTVVAVAGVACSAGVSTGTGCSTLTTDRPAAG